MSWTKSNRFTCDECGRFIGFTEPRYEWTYYGDSTMSAPPDENHAHKDCYENLSEEQKALTERACWMKPRLITPPQGEKGGKE